MIAPTAFGSADALNKRGGFDLRRGHTGPRFAVAGERLRFVDGGTIGPVLAWEPDMSLVGNREALRLIEPGHDRASVGMANMNRRVVDVPDRQQLVTAAELEHVALLLDDTGKTACYPGARAMAFRRGGAGGGL